MALTPLRRLIHVLFGSGRLVAADARAFTPASEGSGIFGHWTLDAHGLPAYQYTLDQLHDNRARYPNSENLNRRDHWHQIGNDRVTALVSNDGTVQLYIGDRGGVWLNRFEARDRETQTDSSIPPPRLWLTELAAGLLLAGARLLRRLRLWWYRLRAAGIQRRQHEAVIPRGATTLPVEKALPATERLAMVIPHAYAGGFAYLDDGQEAWASAYRYRPAGCDVSRTFGIGRCETTATYRNIRVTRQVYAPSGDDPLLLSDVRVDNLGKSAVDLRYYEYWDVNIQRLQLQWLRTGAFAAAGDEARRALNDDYIPSVTLDEQWRTLRFHQQPRPGAPQGNETAISDVDRLPYDVFLTNLSGSHIAACYSDKASFFGQGGAVQPDAVRTRSNDQPAPKPNSPPVDAAMPYCLVLRHDLHLEPGAGINLRFGHGAARPGDSLLFLDKYRSEDTLERTVQCWKEHLVYFLADGERALQREVAWHTHNLLAATVYSDYYNAHVVPQGSAYLYLHGADGAPRDQALFALPLVYIRPKLAREMLCLLMSLMHADSGALPYAFTGYGYHSNALGVHTVPSDLDLFLLLALNEYLAASGDAAFLDAEAPFYPRGAQPQPPFGMSVLDHIRVALHHLMETVGTGENGLLRIGDGDWSDSIVIDSVLNGLPLGINLENTREHGESVPNSQMALYVLPRIAALLDMRDPELAGRIRAFTAGLQKAVMLQWNGRWFTRAVLRDLADDPVIVADDWISLEAQPWALISGVAARMGRQGVEGVLIDMIRRLLDDPSPIGAPLNERGMVWPAVSQLLTWGYTRSRPDLAWRSLKRNTFAARSRVFPTVWHGVWSGPDGVYSVDNSNAGQTWVNMATPMTDFPVMNANPDAMALLGLLRVCGLEPSPTGDGLLIAPCSPPERFVLDLPLIRLDVAPGRIAGEYRAAGTGSLTLHVRVPSQAHRVAASIDGQPVAAPLATANEVALPLAFAAGQRVAFEVTWAM
ncbi:MAG: hypothetical protein M1434_01450 [Chloroflexi bacterium]|nr:hypothetical protein [Chloroflexota bacterium]MCL5273396.1 hypothetical protein [Chloroflexota bacterium]